MIKVSVRVMDGPVERRVSVTAESIRRAVEIARGRYGGVAQVIFPIEDDFFFGGGSEPYARALLLAGRSIRTTLRRAYGSPEAAERAVREAARDVEGLEIWASAMESRRRREALGEDPYADLPEKPFTFSLVPEPYRQAAILSMAAAMLAWTAEQEERREGGAG